MESYSDSEEYGEDLLVEADPGIGVEFENPTFTFRNSDCSKEQTYELKRKVIDNRQGSQFQFTVDTMSDEGVLNAEYILDGKKIKVGKGHAAEAGRAAFEDFVDWFATADKDNVQIADSECNPWTADTNRDDPEDFEWEAQVTTPMPLEGLYSLMLEQKTEAEPRNVLTGYWNARFMEEPALVMREYFQTNPNGMESEEVGDDVLAFASLVLSYAKGAYGTSGTLSLSSGASPKLMTSFMPRTDFNGLFHQVRDKIPGDLYKLFETLACYTTVWDEETQSLSVELDDRFSSGTVESPKPKRGVFARLAMNHGGVNLKIKDWIDGIASDREYKLVGRSIMESEGGKDMLSAFDEGIDGSIGGFEKATETVLDTDRHVPLFEFRDLTTVKTSEWEYFMARVDESVERLHRESA